MPHATPLTTNPAQRAHPAVIRAALRSRRRTSYDPLANRITSSNANAQNTNYSYNANNQLTQAGNVSYSYDANGNTTSQTDAGNANNTRSYVYDTDNRLIEVHDAANAIIATYRYDPFGRRLSKTANNQSTYYFYSAEGLIAEADSNGQIIQSYGYAPGSTFTTNPLWTKLTTAGTTTYYTYQNDHLGTPQKLLNQSGLTVWSATYDAFGRATVDPASTITNNLRFPGQYADQETGLHYNWMRFYDPSTGRYVTWDPIGLRGGKNLYTYVKGNPMRWVDPVGEFAIVVVPVIEGVGALCARFPTACANIVRAVGAGIGVAIGSTSSSQKCNNDDKKPNCRKASPWDLAQAGITDEHEYKDEHGARPWSRYDICKCDDGSIRIAPVGKCGKTRDFWE